MTVTKRHHGCAVARRYQIAHSLMAAEGGLRLAGDLRRARKVSRLLDRYLRQPTPKCMCPFTVEN